MAKFIESHISVMSTLFQSQGLAVTWIITPSGEHEVMSPSLAVRVIGVKQHAHHDSRRISLPANGGILLTAIDSMAQPMKLRNSPSMNAFTWLGKLENGWNLMRLQFWVSSCTTQMIPSWSSL